MPIKHAALKEIRKGRRLQIRNQAVRSELKTMTKHLLALVSEKKLDDAKSLIRLVAKKYDKAAARGIIHRNTASRSISRLMSRLHRAQTA